MKKICGMLLACTFILAPAGFNFAHEGNIDDLGVARWVSHRYID